MMWLWLDDEIFWVLVLGLGILGWILMSCPISPIDAIELRHRPKMNHELSHDTS